MIAIPGKIVEFNYQIVQPNEIQKFSIVEINVTAKFVPREGQLDLRYYSFSHKNFKYIIKLLKLLGVDQVSDLVNKDVNFVFSSDDTTFTTLLDITVIEE